MELSIVIPVYCSQNILPHLHQRLTEVLAGCSYEILFVNDGSHDQSFAVLKEIADQDERVIYFNLSRNFGHQGAISCGLQHARGQAVVVMDDDLQDPPEVVLEFVAKWRQGYHVVYGQRRNRKESFIKRCGYYFFYRILTLLSDVDIPLDAGDFTLMDRKVVDAILSMPESVRFIRGLRAWVGFRQTVVSYDRPERFSGQTTYTWRKLFSIALDGIFSFSTTPIQLAFILGWGFSFFALLGFMWIFFQTIVHGSAVPGFPAIICSILLVGGIQMLVLSILGQYIRSIFKETKARPQFIIAETNVTNA